MYKVSLIFSEGEFADREDYFFDTQREAKNWLEFYRRTNQFMLNNRSYPILHSYMFRFSF